MHGRPLTTLAHVTLCVLLAWLEACTETKLADRPPLEDHAASESAVVKELLHDAGDALVAGDRDKAILILHEGVLASGFSPPVVEALAYAYELRGEFEVANWVRFGAELNWIPWPSYPPPVTGPPEQTDALRSAVSNAAAYFQHRGSDVKPLVAVMFDYLGRKFDLPWTESIVQGFSRRVTESAYFPFLRKLIDPDYDVLPPFERLGPIDRDMMPALYCSYRPLPESYFAQLFWSSHRGGYDLTHAAGALEWAYEQGCIEDSESWRALRAYQVAQMWLHAETEPEATDLFAETIAMLYYVGAREVVRPEWIARLVRAQLADGGWAPPGQTETVDHISMLAYWGLLAATRPDAPPTKMTVKEPR